MQRISFPTEPVISQTSETTATFEIGSLYPGYGITIGNALRRILLSSLPGAAITSVKIAGADHEFTAFPGVKEDIIHILLNLKQVRFRVETDGPESITLTAKGADKPKEVTAGDFKTPTGVTVINPDLVIATLVDKKATLEMEAEVSRGLGYEPVERRTKEKLPVGTIALDAIYTPVRRANFRVENMRVGDRTDFNRLILEIETDGSITPAEAFNHTIEILDSHVHILKNGASEPTASESQQ